MKKALIAALLMIAAPALATEPENFDLTKVGTIPGKNQLHIGRHQITCSGSDEGALAGISLNDSAGTKLSHVDVKGKFWVTDSFSVPEETGYKLTVTDIVGKKITCMVD